MIRFHQLLYVLATANLIHAHVSRAHQPLLNRRQFGGRTLAIDERCLRTFANANLRRWAAVYRNEWIDAFLQIEEQQERFIDHLAVDAALQALRIGGHQDTIDVAVSIG